MRGTTGFSLFAAALAGAALASPARAADEDTQAWLYLDAVVPLADRASATFELSPRFREGDDQLLLRGTAEYRISPAVAVGGGGAWVEFADGHEARTHQQLSFSTGPLSFRTRVEERFFAGADRFQLRLRQKAQLSGEVAPGTKLSAAAELFYIARTEDPSDKARVDSWRFVAAAQRRVSKHLDAALGYQLIYAPREGAPDHVTHVPQLTLVFRP